MRFEFFDFYELNTWTILLRLVLAVIIGGMIGLERGANKRPAGFRTHILVCVGATIAMLTNQYMYDYFGNFTDPGRLGAQVITGVGFLGVGTILVTGRYKIKGLTTAAGLWASACIGLAIGIGFYSGAIIAALLVLISLALLPKIEVVLYERSRIFGLYVELDSINNYKPFIAKVREYEIAVLETHFDKSWISTNGTALSIYIKLPKNCHLKDILEVLAGMQYVIIIEEL